MSSCNKKIDSDRFSSIEEEFLIELVAGHEELWKLSHKDFKNNLKKDVIWNSIGEKLGKTGTACKNRWRNIRDYYKKSRRDDITSTGKPAKKKRANYWDALSFLNESDQDREVLTNADSGDQVAIEVDPDDITEIIFHTEGYPGAEDASFHSSASTSVETRDTVNKQDLKQKKKPSTSEAVLQALKERKEDRERLMKTLEAAFEDNEKDDMDDIDFFFKSVALTVKGFSPAEKAETKLKVMELVTAIEMRRLKKTNDC